MARAQAVHSEGAPLRRIKLAAIWSLCCALLIAMFEFANYAFISRNTSLSPGYSAANFASLKEGDDVGSVLAHLGLPLDITVNFGITGGLPIEIKAPKTTDIEKYSHIPGGNLVLQYSGCLHRLGDQFRNVSVTVTNGRVQAKRDQIYHELW